MAFDCMSQEPTAHGHVGYEVQESLRTAFKGAEKGQLLSRK